MAATRRYGPWQTGSETAGSVCICDQLILTAGLPPALDLQAGALRVLRLCSAVALVLRLAYRSFQVRRVGLDAGPCGGRPSAKVVGQLAILGRAALRPLALPSDERTFYDLFFSPHVTHTNTNK